jgi:hypothetical protein
MGARAGSTGSRRQNGRRRSARATNAIGHADLHRDPRALRTLQFPMTSEGTGEEGGSDGQGQEAAIRQVRARPHFGSAGLLKETHPPKNKRA